MIGSCINKIKFVLVWLLASSNYADFTLNLDESQQLRLVYTIFFINHRLLKVKRRNDRDGGGL